MKRVLTVAAAAILLMLAVPSGALAAAGKSSPPSSGPNEQSMGIKRPVEVSLKISGWCDNTGSDINLIGDIALGGTGQQVTLANNVKGTHAVVATASSGLTISGDDEQLLAMKPPAFGGVGGNPHAFVRLYDTDDNLVYEQYIGRCVEGAKGADNPFSLELNEAFTVNGGIATVVSPVECSSNRSLLNISSTDWSAGVSATIYLVSQINKPAGEPGVHFNEADVVAEATANLLAVSPRPGKGWWTYSPEGAEAAGFGLATTQVHGPGGNPLVFNLMGGTGDVQAWSQSDNSTWGTLLGRCNKI